MSQSNDSRGSIGDALTWVARIIAISLLTFFPALLGQWLDQRFGMRWAGWVGLVLGMSFGFASLLKLATGPSSKKR